MSSNIKMDILTVQKIGYVVMEALQVLNEPASLHMIINNVAETHNLKSEIIKRPIKLILQNGLVNGILHKENGRYSVCDEYLCNDDNINDNVDKYNNSDEDEVDACCPTKKRKTCSTPPVPALHPFCLKSKPCCSKPPPPPACRPKSKPCCPKPANPCCPKPSNPCCPKPSNPCCPKPPPPPPACRRKPKPGCPKPKPCCPKPSPPLGKRCHPRKPCKRC